jgi:hypothetical protein
MSEVKNESIRRTIYIPGPLARELLEVTPAEERDNFNQLVRTALEMFINTRKKQAVKIALAEMAEDPDIKRECKEINREFAELEADGLS